MFIKHILKCVLCVQAAFSMSFMDMYHFRCAPSTSHSNILKFKVAVARVSGVSVFKMCLWQGGVLGTSDSANTF